MTPYNTKFLLKNRFVLSKVGCLQKNRAQYFYCSPSYSNFKFERKMNFFSWKYFLCEKMSIIQSIHFQNIFFFQNMINSFRWWSLIHPLIYLWLKNNIGRPYALLGPITAFYLGGPFGPPHTLALVWQPISERVKKDWAKSKGILAQHERAVHEGVKYPC